MESGGIGACISPIYCRISIPGFRSLLAYNPHWPLAGWEGSLIGVILTRGEGPLVCEGGMGRASGVGVRRVLR